MIDCTCNALLGLRSEHLIFFIDIHKQNVFLKLPLSGFTGLFLAPLRGSQYSLKTRSIIYAIDVSYLVILSFVGKN